MVDGSLTMGSVFAGIGGFDLAAERAGLRVVWQIEIDRTATAILARYWPEVRRYGDITRIDPAVLEPVDVVCGGFPCQDLSVAGLRAGLAGERSRLFFEFCRLVAALRPPWVVLENVPGLYSSWSPTEPAPDPVPGATWEVDEISDMGTVIATLCELGYSVAWRGLDAEYFHLAQRRTRVFFVGYLGAPTHPLAVLFEPGSLRGDPPPRRPAGSTVATLLASGAGTDRPAGVASEPDFLVTQSLTGTFANGGADDNKAQRGFLVPIQDVRGSTRDKTDAGQGIGIGADGDVMYTLDATSQHAVAYALRADPGGVGQGYNTTYVVARALEAHAPRYDSETETLIAHTLRAEGAGASEDGTGRGTPLVAATLTAQYGKHGGRSAGKDAGVRNAVVNFLGVRRLMPRECERLQGFPDDWTRWGAEGRPISDSARYRLLGNAVAVPVVEWILRRLVMVATGRPASNAAIPWELGE
jgi:DNA (cytosine-5)-methyltransferase 1